MAQELLMYMGDDEDLHEWVQNSHDHPRPFKACIRTCLTKKHADARSSDLGNGLWYRAPGRPFPAIISHRNDSGSKHKMKVLAKDGDKVCLIRFGHRD